MSKVQNAHFWLTISQWAWYYYPEEIRANLKLYCNRKALLSSIKNFNKRVSFFFVINFQKGEFVFRTIFLRWKGNMFFFSKVVVVFPFFCATDKRYRIDVLNEFAVKKLAYIFAENNNVLSLIGVRFFGNLMRFTRY